MVGSKLCSENPLWLEGVGDGKGWWIGLGAEHQLLHPSRELGQPEMGATLRNLGERDAWESSLTSIKYPQVVVLSDRGVSYLNDSWRPGGGMLSRIRVSVKSYSCTVLLTCTSLSGSENKRGRWELGFALLRIRN